MIGLCFVMQYCVSFQVDHLDEEQRAECFTLTGFIQARLCKIQGLFKDFSKSFLLFSRTDNLRKILIYTLKFYF